MDLKVLYEDNHIIAVYKPANILSQKDNTNDESMVELTKDYLKKKYEKPGNVYLGLLHRLDRPVGGILIMAKTSKAAKRLSEKFKNNNIKKKYLTVVHNNNLKASDTLINYVDKNKDNYCVEKKDGKEARLEYVILENTDKLSLVDINLITGRHHQIRYQFKAINSPIYGDYRYGYKEEGGIALINYEVSFIHPITKKTVNIKYLDSKIPVVFKQFNLEKLLHLQ